MSWVDLGGVLASLESFLAAFWELFWNIFCHLGQYVKKAKNQGKPMIFIDFSGFGRARGLGKSQKIDENALREVKRGGK